MGTAQAAAILGLPRETVRLFMLLTKSLQDAKIEPDVPHHQANQIDQDKLLDELMCEYSHRL